MSLRVIDDQPISATFFHEGKWLSEWITPNSLEIQKLYEDLTRNIGNQEDRIIACWDWVANEVKYKAFINARIVIEGQTDHQPDYWQMPSQCRRTKVGNCVNKSFLLASLLRNELPADKVFAVLGNLYNGKPGGHAWVQVILGGHEFIIESTRPDVQPLVPVEQTDRYEAVHLFNDEKITMIEGKTAIEPYSRCYSAWLVDYLDKAYIQGQK